MSDRLPLLDEVNELIEKERMLLSLKLLDKKNEVEEWKLKYDSLVEKIGYESANVVNINLLEVVATVDNNKTGQHSVELLRDLNYLLLNRKYSWILDLSQTVFENSALMKLCKYVFGKRGICEGINTVILKKCAMDDDFNIALQTILSATSLQALDLSHNNLGEGFFIQLLAALQDRRVTPQYLLLGDNAPFSTTVKNFSAILSTLTENSWGLTVSLADFADVTNEHDNSKNNKKTSSNRELNYDYKEIVKQPYRIYEFLNAYNISLQQGRIYEVNGNGGDGKSSNNSKKKSTRTKISASTYGRVRGLHNVTVLGLQYHHMSRKSISLLETTLQLISSSLTDLDLSFAYIGYHGAEVLRKMLLSPSNNHSNNNNDDGGSGCQLVRLGLMGNALGDVGVSLLCQGVQISKTLVHLDLRSNNITTNNNNGTLIRSLYSALHLLPPVLHPTNGSRQQQQQLQQSKNNAAMSVLAVLDLRNNGDISHAAVHKLRCDLAQCGSVATVRWDDRKVEEKEVVDDISSNNNNNNNNNNNTAVAAPVNPFSTVVSGSMMLNENQPLLLLYQYAHKVRSSGVIGQPVRLYSIDLTTALSQYYDAKAFCNKKEKKNYNNNNEKNYDDDADAIIDDDANANDSRETAITLQWKWRTVRLGSEARSSSLFNSTMKKRHSSSSNNKHNWNQFNAGYLGVGSRYSLYYEVHVIVQHRQVHWERHRVTASSGITRRLFESNGNNIDDGSDWIRSYLMLSNLPASVFTPTTGIKGVTASIDIFVVVVDEHAIPGRTIKSSTSNKSVSLSGNKQVVAFESIDLQVDRQQPHHTRCCTVLGGDDNSNRFMTAVAPDIVCGPLLQLSRNVHAAPQGMTLLRRLLWQGTATTSLSYSSDSSSGGGTDGSTIKLMWSSRLLHANIAAAGAATEAGGRATDPHYYHSNIGYNWEVRVISAAGSSKMITQSTVISVNRSLNNSHTKEDPRHKFNDTNTSTTTAVSSSYPVVDSLLYAWQWRECSTLLTGCLLHPGDAIMLYGKVISNIADYSAAILQRHSIAVQDCVLLQVDVPPIFRQAANETKLNRDNYSEVTKVASNFNAIPFYAIHDDSTCQLPF